MFMGHSYGVLITINFLERFYIAWREEFIDWIEEPTMY